MGNMGLFQDLANATVRIECGSSRGSGFHFLQPNVIVTNNHVVDGFGASVTATTENGTSMPLKLRAASGTAQHDFAVFEVQTSVPAGRQVLKPKVLNPVERGREVIFSGFPHGIADLLVQRAVVAGLVSNSAFCLDGSVNGGNSGGPILDLDDGTVVGIVTQRRFLGSQDLATLKGEAENLRKQSQAMGGTVRIMGINFGDFSRLMAEGMLLIREVLEANANTGIGIGFSIEFVAEKCREIGIT